MSNVELTVRGSQLGIAGIEQRLKQLKCSQLMKISEFIDMFRTAEKFHRDMKLSYLTCRNKSYLVQQAEDAQFYHILLEMMQEIANIHGFKQREEVMKLYRWFKANRGVLHSSPHFKGSRSTVDLHTEHPRLKFSDDALNFYSIPSEKRNKSPKKVNFCDEKPSRLSSTKTKSIRKGITISKAFEGLGVNRPVTAPPGLRRPKETNHLSSSSKVLPPPSESPSLTAHYLIHGVSPHQAELQAFDRPSTAIGLLRPNNSPVEDVTGSSPTSIDLNQNVKKEDNEVNRNSVTEEESIVQEGGHEERSKFPLPHLVNPVAQQNFVEEDVYFSGPAPNKVLSVHVDIPDIGLVQSSLETEQPRPIDKWKEYQEAQVYGQDIIGTHQLFGRSGTPGGIRYTAHDRGEQPELYTQHVISSYAMENETAQPNNREALHYKSLEDFYKTMKEYKPGKKRSKGHVRLGSAEQTKDKAAVNEVTEEISKRSPTANSKSTNVHFESIIELTERVGDKMTSSKEKLSPDPRAGFRKPSVGIKQARPHTAPPHSGKGTLFENTPVPPPNSYKPASTCSSIDYTPRNRKGEPIIFLPEKSEYTVHMRADERNHTQVPHAIHQNKTHPENQRYKWQDEDFGHSTYIGGIRTNGGTPRTSPRSAGGNCSVRRPKTADESMQKRWNTVKLSDHNQRVPQAASHMTTMIQPQTIASMVVVNHLGTENRRLKSRMGNVYGMSLDEEFPEVAGNMEFVRIISPAPIQVRTQNDTNRENKVTDEVENTPNNIENNTDDNSVVGQKDDINTNSSRVSTAPSLSSEIYQLTHEVNRIDEDTTSGTREGQMSTADNVEMMNRCKKNIADPNITDSYEIEKEEDHGVSMTAVNEMKEREEKDKDKEKIDKDGAEKEDKGEEENNTNTFWLETKDEELEDTIQTVKHGRRYCQRPVSTALPRLSTRDDGLPCKPSMCGQESRVKLVTSVLGLDTDLPRMHRSLDSFTPSVYVGLTNEHRAALMTHPTGLTKSSLEFGILMPHAQKMALTPRKSPRESPIISPHLSPKSSQKSSPHSSPRPSQRSSPHSSPRPSQRSSPNSSPRPSQRPSPHSSPRPSHRPSPHSSPRPNQRSSPRPLNTPNDVCSSDHSGNTALLPSCHICIGMSSQGSSSTNSVSESELMISPVATSNGEPHSEQESHSNQEPPSEKETHLNQEPQLEQAEPHLNQDLPSEHDDYQSESQNSPPRILIRRPSSAPLLNNNKPDGMSQFRPVSPASQTGRRSRSPHLGLSSPVNTRPSSARLKPKGKEWNGRPVAMFGEPMITDDAALQRSKQARESVNIRDLFSNKASKKYMKEKERHERLKWEKIQKENEENFRLYHEEMWRREMALMNRGDITFRDWEKEYMATKAQRERLRLQKMNSLMRKQALQNKKALDYLKRIGPHVDVWELFYGEKRGISKAQMKRAAITLQKYLRGVILRRKLEAVKLKSRVHAPTFKKFLDYYYAMMKRIARRYLIKKPSIYFDLWQLDDFMERKRYYEYVFAKRAHPGDELEVKELEIYFKECDHYPSKTEIYDAVRYVTKQDPEKPGLRLKEAQVVEISFQIYVPPGCGLTTDQTRKSTWLNPLVNGVEAKRLVGSSEVEEAQLRKSMALVFKTYRERKEKEEQEMKMEKE